jgi:hypothetical protein
MRRLSKLLALVAVLGLIAAACGGGEGGDTTEAPATTAAPAGSDTTSGGDDGGSDTTAAAPEAPVCDATMVGDIVRCENFYTDFWPIIEAAMNDLYEEAKSTADGVVVNWDWFELDPAVVALFNEKWPDLTMKSVGLTWERPSAIVAARATGSETTDVMGGTITVGKDLFDEGFWADIDWTEYGIPPEFLELAQPGSFPDSINGYTLHFNTDVVDPADVPTNLNDLLGDDWANGRFAMQDFQNQGFAGIGMVDGEQAMVDLITGLKESGNMLLSGDAPGLLSTGDVAAILATQIRNPNPALGIRAFENSNIFGQYAGVNADAQNPAGAMIWDLWNAFDPDWINLRLTDEEYQSSAIPWFGLPSDVMGTATGVMAKNIDAFVEALENDWDVWETLENRDEYVDMMNAASAATYAE